jgi:hypothetical protein
MCAELDYLQEDKHKDSYRNVVLVRRLNTLVKTSHWRKCEGQ